MIQSNELRSGNLIIGTYENEDDNLIHETICTFKFYNCYDNYYNVESKDGIEEFTSFKPIPITEEILLKCGFVQCENEFWYQKNIISISPSVGTYEIQGSKLSLSVMRENPIRYLHQLQNLYFSLTNEDLTFNNL